MVCIHKRFDKLKKRNDLLYLIKDNLVNPEKKILARKIYLLLASLFITSLVVSNLIFQKFFYWYPFNIEIFGEKLFYLSVGSLFLINFNLINTNLKSHLIVFGVASYSICENIGSFVGPTIIGALISFNINYFLIIFGVIFFLIFTIFNFSTKLNGGPSGT